MNVLGDHIKLSWAATGLVAKSRAVCQGVLESVRLDYSISVSQELSDPVVEDEDEEMMPEEEPEDA